MRKHVNDKNYSRKDLKDQRFGSLSTGVVNLKSLGNSSAALR